MPKAILAIRSYPATMLLALCVFLLTLAITTGSLGTVGGGGDDGDGGSGMGGTGKSGEFGGSGFGGTGAPSPFLGLLDPDPTDENTDDVPPRLEAAEPSGLSDVEEMAVALYETPANIPATPAISNVQDSLAADATRPAQLTELIQESLENHLLTEEVPSSLIQPFNSPVIADDDSSPEIRIAFEVAEPVDVDAAQISNETTISETSRNVESQREKQESISSQALQQLAEANATANTTTDEDSSSQGLDRSTLPERIQRPELPPFQRITPVQRPTVMPPRVQPMRI